MTTPATDLDLRGETITGVQLAALDGESNFGTLNFENAEFPGVTKLGPISADKLILDGATFDQHVQVEVQAKRVSCVGTRFDGGVTLRVNRAVVDATNASFGSTSSISTSLAFNNVYQPRLVSLRGTDVSNLVLVDVDLVWCLFAGAHRLDQLRFEDRCRFRWTSNGSSRQMLFEEALARGLANTNPYVPDILTIRWGRLAEIYRSLRKALEDSKNEAGAGDFYYGEMEARRRATNSHAEWVILSIYWLLSGYGQRAGRAVAALGVLVALVCVLLFTVGLPGGVQLTGARIDQALRIGMGAVVFREAGQALTSAGNWTVMVARFAGPVLLALAVLAIRARVKR